MTVVPPTPLPLVLDGGAVGWLHAAPPGAGAPRLGVVLCGAMGFEGMRAYRGWRGLANALAARGLPVLRFDYEGCGDSAGDGAAPDQIDRWLDSVRAAVSALRAHGGAAEVSLVGLRLGGLLAAEAAASLGGVARLALLAPVTAGRSHARELRLVADAWREDGVPVPFAVPDPSPAMNVVGDRWSPELLAALGRHDLRRLDRRPAPEVLLLDAVDRPVAPFLAPRLAELGAALEVQPFPGLDEYLLRDESLSRPPLAAFAALADWLARPLDGAAGAPFPAAAPLPAEPAVVLPHGRELPVQFGGGLFGVFSEPEAPREAVPAVLVLNTGAQHRAGNGRLGALMCRRLGAEGVASLRMDLRGLGDSDDRPDTDAPPLYDLAARADVRAALDWLEARGHRRVVVAAVCSGAFLAFHAALEEPRIVGTAIINLQQFIWRQGDSFEISKVRIQQNLRTYRYKLLQPRCLLRILRGRIPVGRILGRLAMRSWQHGRREAEGLAERWLGVETRSGQAVRWVRALSARGVAVRLWYGPNDPGLGALALHCGPMGRSLRGLPGVEVSILEGVDHSITFQPGRDWFMDRLLGFVRDCAAPAAVPFPAGQAAAAPAGAAHPPNGLLAA